MSMWHDLPADPPARGDLFGGQAGGPDPGPNLVGAVEIVEEARLAGVARFWMPMRKGAGSGRQAAEAQRRRKPKTARTAVRKVNQPGTTHMNRE
mgnify:CR=1 FL=1